MIKALITDLDGTILFNDAFPEVVREGINTLIKNGVKVYIASGRMLSSIYHYHRMLGLDTPIIAYNGAMIGDKDLNIIYHNPIEYSLWYQIFNMLLEEDLQINLYFNDSLYIFRKNGYGGNYPIQNKVPAFFVDKIEDLPELPTTKVLGIGDPDIVRKVQVQLKERYNSNLYITTSSPTYLEIMNRDVSKGRALSILSSITGISISEMAGLGDSFNDLELIMDSGLGITFDNAPLELKENADYVTGLSAPEGFREVVDFILWKNLY
ncbi:MAG TPA: Cof-type HAD-IIB family hydrolase [bacterium]|nr:Cof-type HAD-IIB family hydrolase [bacterium]